MKTFLLVILLCSSLMAVAQRNCATNQYWQSQLNNDPALLLRYTQIERLTKNHTILSKKVQGGEVAELPLIIIPVVIHILYNNEKQNISNAQIKSQLDILNKDFRKLNEDTMQIPFAFAALSADCRIQFELAKVDPEGRATTGIVRKKTEQVSWLQDDKMKFSISGGSDAWNSRNYLNIWVCNLTKSLLGYSTFPGALPEKDGVVIRTDVFGIIGNNSAAYNKGRTTTHEVGHWLNLKHLWGDKDCGDDDVDDTPSQKTYNSGCPSFPKITANSCNSNPFGDMFMNFMDFSNDACLHMFTIGQKERIHSLFGVNGARETIVYSTALGNAWNETAATETKQNTPSDFTIFPNPASTLITLQFNNQNMGSPGFFQIYDATGKLVKEGKNNGTPIAIHSFQQGMYFIKLQYQDRLLLTKFLKQ